LIGGLVGGLIVSWLSGSQLAVSGPAAGLTVIIFNGIETLGSFQAMLVACVLAGIMQLGLGFLRAGIIGAFFPSCVIEGMLAAIGLILIIKQIPHATGYHAHYEGDESYMKDTVESSLIEVFDSFSGISPGSVIISIVALLLLMLWSTAWFKTQILLKLIPGPLVAVIWGIGYNLVTRQYAPDWTLSTQHLVSLPVSEKATDFFNNFVLPDAGYLSNLGNPHDYCQFRNTVKS
jgi:MFS superfamily sulfate permease-like transporter